MDLHAPEGPVRSVKDFLVHIGIVTIGILIALGLEQLVETYHRHRLAEEALNGFRHELADNRKELDDVVAAMPKLRERIAAEIANLESPTPRAIDYPGIQFNLMSTASWDTAVATQALNELPYETAHRFAETYGIFRLFDEVERKGMGAWQEMRSYGTDVAKLTPEQRRALIEKLRYYENVTYLIDFFGQNVGKVYDKALAEK